MAKKKELKMRDLANGVLISVMIAFNVGGGDISVYVPINVYVQT